MDVNAQKDHFSRAVVRAVAAVAGVGATVPEFDQNSEDVEFAAPDIEDGPGPKLSAQLKCTQNVDPSGAEFSYALPVHNYNHLRWPSDRLYVPRILILVHVPSDPADWFDCDPEKIVLKRCAYWLSLAGAPETDNVSTVSVTMRTERVFDPDALHANLRPPGASL